MNRCLIFAGLACALAACTDDLDPPWQLDHTRIIAVRATPPSIASGETSTLDGLIGTKGMPTHVAPPLGAQVVSPTELADVIVHDGDDWKVVAPSEDRLAAARTQLNLAADAPVPLQVGVAYGTDLVATKVVFLGASADNPVLPTVTINDAPAPAEGEQVTIDKAAAKNPVVVDVDNTKFDVAWLTSCGTMHDFDLPHAYVKVEDDDPTSGELGVVLRNTQGGVDWRLWPIQAQ